MGTEPLNHPCCLSRSVLARSWSWELWLAMNPRYPAVGCSRKLWLAMDPVCSAVGCSQAFPTAHEAASEKACRTGKGQLRKCEMTFIERHQPSPLLARGPRPVLWPLQLQHPTMLLSRARVHSLYKYLLLAYDTSMVSCLRSFIQVASWLMSWSVQAI